MNLYQINGTKELIKQASMYKTFGLDLNQKQVVAFVGAGGKTTTIHQLAKELALLKKRVIITTTTHMFLPTEYGVLEEDREALLHMLQAKGIAIVGSPCGEGKMTKVSASFFQWMKSVSDYLLVEADGSKRLPIKVPDEHEPVIPKETDRVIIVTGLSCLSRPLPECCHRWKLAMQILNCNSSHTISSVDVARLMKEGYCNGLTVPYKILLNQGDDDEVRLKAVEIIEALKDLKIDEKTVVVGNTKK
ncbi:MAG: selenium cofactor biosynthesis protein YqeC [Lachnospiraceae bacterium]